MKLKMILKLKQNIGKNVYIAVVNTKKSKLLNRKLAIENEVMENEIKNEIKVKTKYCVDIAVVDKAQKSNKIQKN